MAVAERSGPAAAPGAPAGAPPLADVFSRVEASPAAVDLLRRAVATGHVAHAYAFVGPAGSGRRATALAFAQALVAPGGGRAAERVARGAHPDVLVIEPTPPAHNPKGIEAIRVEDIRALERLAALAPFEAPVKVFVVAEAERMTAATPQAFLKTLEEPPARTVIVLLVTQVRALPPTVLSRCQVVRFAPRGEPGAPALLPGGGGTEREEALGWLAAARAGGLPAALRCGEAIGRDRGAAERVVETCWLWYRDLLCLKGGGASDLVVFEARAEALRAHADRVGVDEVVEALGACREAWHAIQGNVSPRLTVEVLLGRLARRAA